jgi:hypothetical protein
MVKIIVDQSSESIHLLLLLLMMMMMMMMNTYYFEWKHIPLLLYSLNSLSVCRVTRSSRHKKNTMYEEQELLLTTKLQTRIE